MNRFFFVIIVVSSVFITGCGQSQCHRKHCPRSVSHPPVMIPAGPAQLTIAADGPLVFCQRCGVIAGEVTKCPAYSSHDFTSVSPDSVVICRRCGARPTLEPVKCPAYSSHDFDEFE